MLSFNSLHISLFTTLFNASKELAGVGSRAIYNAEGCLRTMKLMDGFDRVWEEFNWTFKKLKVY